MKKVKIYQLKKDENIMRNIGFLSYRQLMHEFGGVDLNNYNLIYECERDNDYNFDESFIEFNAYHPTDFNGWSMSVSDVVVIDDVAKYVDNYGFAELESGVF